MKVFTVEFTIFNAIHWKNVNYRITAKTEKELKDAVWEQLQ